MKKSDLTWAAGLLEGEGCFYTQHARRYPAVKCNMTDRDVVVRLYRLFGVGHLQYIHTPFMRARGWKVQWSWQVQAQADARRVMRLVLPYMGKRRTAKIKELLARQPARRTGMKEAA